MMKTAQSAYSDAIKIDLNKIAYLAYYKRAFTYIEL